MQPKTFIRTLSLIHASLCAGLLLFGVFAYGLNGGFNVGSADTDIFVYIVPVVSMIGYFTSKFIYKNMLQKIPENERLQTKLARYRVANIFQYALVEAPALLALFVYLGNGTALYLAIAMALGIYLFVKRPTLNRLMEEVSLTFEEKKQFDTLRS